MRIRTAIFETNFFNTYFLIALVLISAGWWENYVDEASFEFLGKMKSRLTQETKTSIYFISSPAKMIIFLGGMLTSLHLDGFPIHHLFATPFHEIFTHENPLNVTELVQQIDSEMIFNLNLPMGGEHYFLKEVIKITSQWDFPIKIIAVHSLGTLITCLFAKWSCKTLMQSFGFAIPLTLTVPVAMLLLGNLTFYSEIFHPRIFHPRIFHPRIFHPITFLCIPIY